MKAQVEIKRGNLYDENYFIIKLKTGDKQADQMNNGFTLQMPANEYHWLIKCGISVTWLLENIVTAINKQNDNNCQQSNEEALT